MLRKLYKLQINIRDPFCQTSLPDCQKDTIVSCQWILLKVKKFNRELKALTRTFLNRRFWVIWISTCSNCCSSIGENEKNVCFGTPSIWSQIGINLLGKITRRHPALLNSSCAQYRVGGFDEKEFCAKKAEMSRLPFLALPPPWKACSQLIGVQWNLCSMYCESCFCGHRKLRQFKQTLRSVESISSS